MFQPHKTLKIVTNAGNEKNLVMKVQKSRECLWYIATTEQEHHQHLVLTKASRYHLMKRITENILKQIFNRDTND